MATNLDKMQFFNLVFFYFKFPQPVALTLSKKSECHSKELVFGIDSKFETSKFRRWQMFNCAEPTLTRSGFRLKFATVAQSVKHLELRSLKMVQLK